METKDITRHIIWALVISVGWWLVTWLLGMIPTIGAWLIQIISWTFVFGLLFYAINGKGMTHGLVAGIIYAIVFLVVYILLGGMLFALPISGQMLPFLDHISPSDRCLHGLLEFGFSSLPSFSSALSSAGQTITSNLCRYKLGSACKRSLFILWIVYKD